MAWGGPGGNPPFNPLGSAGRVNIPGFADDDDDPPLPPGGQIIGGGNGGAINDLLASVQSSYINDGEFREALARLVINDRHTLENQDLEVIISNRGRAVVNHKTRYLYLFLLFLIVIACS
jgi:hypothetical protein